MGAEIWILLIIIVGAVAAAAGISYGRRGGPSQADLDTLQQQLDDARKEAVAVQENVTGHFERSAMLFGRLAHDYRDFLEHFSESAQELGISELQARELLERADLPLLGDQRNVIDQQAQSSQLESIGAASTETVSGGDSSDSAEAATQSTDSTVQAATGTGAESEQTDPVEPPLIEDVVEPGADLTKAAAPSGAAAPADAAAQPDEAAQTAEATSAALSTVVDVDLDAQLEAGSADERKKA